jgi:dual specificity phosphatase 12
LAAAAYVEMPFKDPVHQIEYLHLNIDDSPLEDLYSHIPAVIEFIEKRPHSNVLVHCVSGISRSGACVIAYVMKKKGINYE